MKLVSMNLVKRGDFLFKVSLNGDTDTIMIHVYNVTYKWSHVRFFDSEILAHDWIEYLMLQENNLTD